MVNKQFELVLASSLTKRARDFYSENGLACTASHCAGQALCRQKEAVNLHVGSSLSDGVATGAADSQGRSLASPLPSLGDAGFHQSLYMSCPSVLEATKQSLHLFFLLPHLGCCSYLSVPALAFPALLCLGACSYPPSLHFFNTCLARLVLEV